MLSITLEIPLHCSLVKLESPASSGAALVSVVSTGVGLADALSSAIVQLEGNAEGSFVVPNSMFEEDTRWLINAELYGQR